MHTGQAEEEECGHAAQPPHQLQPCPLQPCPLQMCSRGSCIRAIVAARVILGGRLGGVLLVKGGCGKKGCQRQLACRPPMPCSTTCMPNCLAKQIWPDGSQMGAHQPSTSSAGRPHSPGGATGASIVSSLHWAAAGVPSSLRRRWKGT